MKIIHKYPKKSKYNNFYLHVCFYSTWTDNDDEEIKLLFEIKGTDKDLKGYHILENKSAQFNKSLYFFGSKEECMEKDDELLLKQKSFEENQIKIKQKEDIISIKNKHLKRLYTDLKKSKNKYEQELKNNNLFWEDNDNSDYSGYEGLSSIINQAQRKLKLKNILDEED